jgi:hypothetical protein
MKHHLNRISQLKRRLTITSQLRCSTNTKDLKTLPNPNKSSNRTVLVLNNDARIAEAVTVQLLRLDPQISIIYAPTLTSAKVFLKGCPVSLIITEETLPDGSAYLLRSTLEESGQEPQLIILSQAHNFSGLPFEAVSPYRFARVQLIGSTHSYNRGLTEASSNQCPTKTHISALKRQIRAELKDSVNNPLQEILAMVYVARNCSETNALLNEALKAIETAAEKIASEVANATSSRLSLSTTELLKIAG